MGLAPESQAVSVTGLAEMLVSGANRLMKPLFALREQYGLWAERARVKTELANLDDRMLADIGITRDEIAEIARGTAPAGRSVPMKVRANDNLLFDDDETDYAA